MSSRGFVIALSLAALLCAGVFYAQPASADSQARIVRLSYTEGNVQIDRATGAGFEKAIMNMPITQGVRLTTGADSHAEVEFEEGSTVRLAPDSSISFSELGLRGSGARFTTVDVDQGTTYFNIKHKGEDEFRVSFGHQEIALPKTVRFRVEVDNREARLSVFKGELELKGTSETAKVKKDETLSLDLNDPGRYELAKGITTLRDDDWDAERNQYHDRYASANAYNNVPYYYGRSDLNYYGAWNYFPGYGYLWRPYDVAYGWDPFYTGAWSWYPGWGWTWVSTYPWGWTPYRYGSWVFVNNYGWCWRPGGWNNWTSVPHVYNPPPAYKAPQPPATAFAGGGTVTPPTVFVGGREGRLPRGPAFVDEDRQSPSRGGIAPVPATTVRTAPAPTGPTSNVSSTTTITPSAPAAGNTPAAAAPTAAPKAAVPDRGTRRDVPVIKGHFPADAPHGRRGGERIAAPAPRAPEQRMAPPAASAPAPRMSAPPAAAPAPAPHSAPTAHVGGGRKSQ